jgi:phosphoglycerate kinase
MMNLASLQGKRVLLRLDLNVPLVRGVIKDGARIERALPTIKQLLNLPVRQVIIMSHLGRPKPGVRDAGLSLRPVAQYLAQQLHQDVPLLAEWPNHPAAQDVQIGLAENVRFLPGESTNDALLAQHMSQAIDAFVFDAFASAHRLHASTVGVANYVPTVVCGPLMAQELQHLGRLVDQVASPYVAVIGGAKVSTKMPLLQALLARVDSMLIGGAMAHTFLVAQGYQLGQSFYEPAWIEAALDLLAEAKKKNKTIYLPQDCVVAKTLTEPARTVAVDAVHATESVFDIGPKSAYDFAAQVARAKTVVWNGPMGVFEQRAFAAGTQVVAKAVARCSGFTAAGGGDTLACLHQFQLGSLLDYVSTGGGAFLHYIEAGTLPVLKRLLAKETG